MNKTKKMSLLVVLAVVSLTIGAQADVVQVTDLRLGGGDVSTKTYYDPGFSGFTTRYPAGSPYWANAAFSGTSSQTGGASPDAYDLALRTWSSQTNIYSLARSATLPAIVQWKIDLTTLDTYLNDNSLAMTALDFGWNATTSGNWGEGKYDMYLSYTNVAEGITLTDISATSATDNKNTFWTPAQGAALGDIVGGTHRVIVSGQPGTDESTPFTMSESILAAYNSGVREFNVQLMGYGYLPGRVLFVKDGSGVYMETSPIPEPATMILLGLGSLALLRKRK